MILCPVRENAHRSPSALALASGGAGWSWAELDAQTAAWAARLRARGIGKGDRIAVLAHNRAELIPLFHAAARVGAVWAPLNARLTGSELRPLQRRIRPRLALAEEAFADRLEGAETLEAAAREPSGGADDESADSAEEGDVRAILFTSGTTGEAKGAELTFGNFEAAARASGANLGAGADQRWLLALPMFHVGGLTMVHRAASYGASLVVHERFDAALVAQELARAEITHLSLVPTGLSRVLDALGGDAPRSLQAVLVGGGPVPEDLAARARVRGFPVLQTYGLTEACAQVATERPGEADGQSAGRPLEGVRVRVVTPEGAELRAGEAGEIEVRGPTVMRGYLDDGAATRAAVRDGWLRTGDLGEWDGRGRLRVHARRTDLIVSGGENVYPAEVEAVLGAHPAVAEVALVGLEDPAWGQLPVALWVPRNASAAQAGALDEWCRARLAGFKVPRRFVAVAELPRTSSGKVDRARAKDVAARLGLDAGRRVGTR